GDVAAAKRGTGGPGLGSGGVPSLPPRLPKQVLGQFLPFSRLIPAGLNKGGPHLSFHETVRRTLEPLGAEFISADDVQCNADGCLTRVGDQASDIVVSDQVHLTEKGSVFLIQSIIDRILPPHPPRAGSE